MAAVDPCYRIELTFIRDMAGSAGESSLQKSVLQMLPTQQSAVSPQDALAGINTLKGSDLYLFCKDGAKGLVDATSNMLSQMISGTEAFVPDL